jgi:hypothetical protein
METTLNNGHSVETLIRKTEEYVNLKGDLLKYKAISKTSEMVAEIASFACIIAVFVPSFALLNIGICLWLGHTIENVPGAFLIMSGFYLLTGIILLLTRRKKVKKAIADLIIKQALK